MPVRTPHRVKLSNEWIDQANAFKRATDTVKKAQGLQTQRFDATTDAEIGWLGERAMKAFLDSSGIGHEWLNADEEQFSGHDFVLHFPSGVKTLDVKTAKPDRHAPESCWENIQQRWSYYYPVTSKPAGKDWIALVYVFRSRKEAYIVGFIPGSEAAKCPQRDVAVPGPGEQYKIPNHKIGPIASKYTDPADFLARIVS
ncbi:MAG TPA: hypothetical protein VF584_20710 [Longimicrobium sp.]